MAFEFKMEAGFLLHDDCFTVFPAFNVKDKPDNFLFLAN